MVTTHMRALLFFIVFAVGSTLPSFAQSQNEMTQQAWAEFDKADKQLNDVYQKVLKSMDDDIAKQKLVTAQKAWIKFRDAQAEVDADSERGGSLANQILAESETEMTKVRTEQLKKYLAGSTGK